MIVEEKLTINKLQFVKHYSNNGHLIRKHGTTEEYAEAIDLLPCNYKYEETDKVIEENESA